MTWGTRNSSSKHKPKRNKPYPLSESDNDDGNCSDEESAKNSNSPSSSSFHDRSRSSNIKSPIRDRFSSPTTIQKARKNSLRKSKYINIAPLPIFWGKNDESPATHLSRFAKFCRANNASSVKTMMRIFPVTLEGEPGLWYDLNIEPDRSLTWEEIKNSFLEAYRSVELGNGLRSELIKLDQGDREPVRSYFLKMQSVLDRWPDHGLPDELLMGIFVDGLREEFRVWILRQRPDSLKEALRLALGFEQVRSVRERRKCGFCGEEAHDEMECEVKEKMRQLWLNGGSDRKLMLMSDNKIDGNGSDKYYGDVGDKKKVQCTQCGRRRLDRNDSVVSRNSNLG